MCFFGGYRDKMEVWVQPTLRSSENVVYWRLDFRDLSIQLPCRVKKWLQAVLAVGGTTADAAVWSNLSELDWEEGQRRHRRIFSSAGLLRLRIGRYNWPVLTEQMERLSKDGGTGRASRARALPTFEIQITINKKKRFQAIWQPWPDGSELFNILRTICTFHVFIEVASPLQLCVDGLFPMWNVSQRFVKKKKKEKKS